MQHDERPGLGLGLQWLALRVDEPAVLACQTPSPVIAGRGAGRSRHATQALSDSPRSLSSCTIAQQAIRTMPMQAVRHTRLPAQAVCGPIVCSKEPSPMKALARSRGWPLLFHDSGAAEDLYKQFLPAPRLLLS